MKCLTRKLLLILAPCLVLACVGCAEDNEKSSGVAATGTSNEGAGQVKPMTPEEAHKAASNSMPSNYPGARKFNKSDSNSASKGGTPAAK